MSLPRNRTTVDSLPPETLHDTLVYLKNCKNDLASTCLVSKRFRSTSLPILYETVVLTFGYHGESLEEQFILILTHEHQGLPFIKNFGIQGSLVYFPLYPKYPLESQMAAEITQTTTMFNLELTIYTYLYYNNWLTDMHLTPTIVNELDARQNMLQGAWVFGPDDLESSGIIAGSLFKFLNTKVQLRDLHLEGIHDMDTILNVFNNFDRMPNKLQRLTVQLQDSNFLESS
ncbi:hypothetical protein TWF703_001760 [Orbilia oligospora]|uniref:F-box domain-containing protein n=1 Tax=Orbilia oligospora TaxID=2813651 RepID=A0A7C8NTV9_ORBOL|nr:hypothetical protein TWF703_001760 [Orbilia oligospora]